MNISEEQFVAIRDVSELAFYSEAPTDFSFFLKRGLSRGDENRYFALRWKWTGPRGLHEGGLDIWTDDLKDFPEVLQVASSSSVALAKQAILTKRIVLQEFHDRGYTGLVQRLTDEHGK